MFLFGRGQVQSVLVLNVKIFRTNKIFRRKRIFKDFLEISRREFSVLEESRSYWKLNNLFYRENNQTSAKMHDNEKTSCLIQQRAQFTDNLFFLLSCGAFGHFATSASNFRELFPGIRSKLCTLNFHFFIPIFREIALGWGMMSAKRSSIRTALTQSNAEAAECNTDGYTSNAVSKITSNFRFQVNIIWCSLVRL